MRIALKLTIYVLITVDYYAESDSDRLKVFITAPFTKSLCIRALSTQFTQDERQIECVCHKENLERLTGVASLENSFVVRPLTYFSSNVTTYLVDDRRAC